MPHLDKLKALLCALAAALLAPAFCLGEDAPAEAEKKPADAKKAVEVKLLRFLDFRLSLGQTRLYVDKVNSTLGPTTLAAARQSDFGTRFVTESLAFRIEAGTNFGGYFRAGATQTSLRYSYFTQTDLLTAPAGTKVTDLLELEPGLDFGMGAELRFFVKEPLRAGLFYEIGYSVAKAKNSLFFSDAVNGEYRCISHVFQLFLDLPLEIEKPLKGLFRPRLGIGGVMLRASSDFYSCNRTLQADYYWIPQSNLLATLSLHLETSDGVYGFLQFDLGGRFGAAAGVGLLF